MDNIILKDSAGNDVKAYRIDEDGYVRIPIAGAFGMIVMDGDVGKDHYYAPSVNVVISVPRKERT